MSYKGKGRTTNITWASTDTKIISPLNSQNNWKWIWIVYHSFNWLSNSVFFLSWNWFDYLYLFIYFFFDTYAGCAALEIPVKYKLAEFFNYATLATSKEDQDILMESGAFMEFPWSDFYIILFLTVIVPAMQKIRPQTILSLLRISIFPPQKSIVQFSFALCVQINCNEKLILKLNKRTKLI